MQLYVDGMGEPRMLLGIYLEEDNDLLTWEAESKGYRSDIYVKVDAEMFQVVAYDMVRITQDFNDEVQISGFYSIDPNLILLKSVTKDEIILTITRLHQHHFFKALKPLAEEDISNLSLVKINE